METACTWVVGGTAIGQMAVLSLLVVGLAIFASPRAKRARELVVDLIKDDSRPEPQPSPASA